MKLRILLALSIAAAPAAANAMPVSEFLTRANALQAKGIAALFSGDYKILKEEIAGSFRQIRAESEAARRAGRRPGACVPNPVKLGTDEILGYLNSIPAPRRRMSVAAAMHGFAARKYPCR